VQFCALDYSLIALYFVFVLAVGVLLERRAGKDTSQFFLSGRNMPWWLIGTSMVATTFSAGVPLLIAGWVYEHGIARNWEWWTYLLTAMATTFFFARLWSRTKVVTDAELLELRYSGTPAKVLRGFRALYMGLAMNTLVMGGGLVAIGKIGEKLLGLDRLTVAVLCGVVALFYSALSGFLGVVITDFVQFIIAMIGSVAMCFCAVGHEKVGGLGGLVTKLETLKPGVLDFLPHGSQAGIPVIALLTYLSVRWWSTVYGGAEPGGASHVAQRMLAARSEKDALLGTLWFNIAHYAVRPWPWILTALATILIFPGAKDGEAAYISAINLLPAGLKGLTVAAFFAAFMSTIDTRLNLGAAYLVNDFYKRFVRPGGTEKHYVLVSRILILVQMVLAYLMFAVTGSLRSVFYIYTAIGAGAGLVLMLRWYWWRVNAWSEITAMALSLLMIVLFRGLIWPAEEEFNRHAVAVLLISTAVVSAGWIVATFLTRPSSDECLKNFYRRVRPAGPLWRPVSRAVECKDVVPEDNIKLMLFGWISGCVLVLAVLFGVGKLLLGWKGLGMFFLILAVLAGMGVAWVLRRMSLAPGTGGLRG